MTTCMASPYTYSYISCAAVSSVRAPRSSVRTAEAATASEVGCGVGDWGTVRRCHVGGFGVCSEPGRRWV
ncbi:beta amylase2 [Zea mays]|uniref:Beta amylase2 n=1 Tax=Zea mays TaxID=4577 RepID=A0A1D6JNC2_MAIZE|nr:beta amylase2 [Zea mays]